MSRIAAPDTISRHPMSDVPPGHRFSLYLPLWNAAWGVDEGAKHEALKECCSLGDAALLLTALRARQQAQAAALPAEHCLVIDAEATAPFATGLGNEHPVENGFAFLTPYGLPYLAGSGAKGVLRRAMEELEQENVEAIDQALIDALFGPEDGGADGSGPPLPDSLRQRGALTFWDVFPEPPSANGLPGKLCVEIMTPHHSEYYQGKQSPHDAGQPTPIYFLALPPLSKLRFVVTHEPAYMPADVRTTDWRRALDGAFARAFDWLGFGAKTAVGFGAMCADPSVAAKLKLEAATAKAQSDAQAARIKRQEQLVQLSPIARTIREFLDARADMNQSELSALSAALKRGQWSGDLKIAIALHVKVEMQHAQKWKERTEKKSPLKDHDHQDTLAVLKWLAGE